MTSLLTLAALGTAEATEIGSRPFGLGLQLGEPFGITGKLYVGGRRNALDFLLGAYYYGGGRYYYGDSLHAAVAYHWHVVELTSGGGVAIPFRVGVGGFLGTYRYGWWDDRYGGDFVLGARVPFGLDFDLESAPVQFYVEIALGVTILPPLGFVADGGIGVRYYF